MKMLNCVLTSVIYATILRLEVAEMRHRKVTIMIDTKKLKAFIKSKGLTQDELAKLAKVSRATIIRLLDGRNVSIENVKK